MNYKDCCSACFKLFYYFDAKLIEITKCVLGKAIYLRLSIYSPCDVDYLRCE